MGVNLSQKILKMFSLSIRSDMSFLHPIAPIKTALLRGAGAHFEIVDAIGWLLDLRENFLHTVRVVPALPVGVGGANSEQPLVIANKEGRSHATDHLDHCCSLLYQFTLEVDLVWIVVRATIVLVSHVHERRALLLSDGDT